MGLSIRLIGWFGIIGSDGLLVVLQHSGHTFKPLETIYMEKCGKVKSEALKVKKRHVELISFMQDVVSA